MLNLLGGGTFSQKWLASTAQRHLPVPTDDYKLPTSASGAVLLSGTLSKTNVLKIYLSHLAFGDPTGSAPDTLLRRTKNDNTIIALLIFISSVLSPPLRRDRIEQHTQMIVVACSSEKSGLSFQKTGCAHRHTEICPT